tara:strand:+ start:83 stop:295 length:213 start_codon:yes stop_codon:yes gene_type:complete
MYNEVEATIDHHAGESFRSDEDDRFEIYLNKLALILKTTSDELDEFAYEMFLSDYTLENAAEEYWTETNA